MRYPLLLACALCLPSCGLVTKIMETGTRVGEGFQSVSDEFTELADSVKIGIEKTNDRLDGLAATYTEAKQAADTDGDGKTTIPEWLQYVLGIGGTGLVGGGGTLLAQATRRRRETEVRNARSDGLKAGLADRIAALEAKA